VVAIAMADNRTILTFDRDYGELIFKHNYQPECGVIYLRLDKFDSNEPGKIIQQLLDNKLFETIRKLTVVDEYSVRQRRY
jgi:predicted nuclease of predicted toxin-antitoxin system